jgi:hypothetical protein
MADVKIEVDDQDLSILRRSGRKADAPRMPERKAGGNTVQSRARAEKPRYMDARRLRPKAEQQVPLNVDVPPEIKLMAMRAKTEFGLTVKTFVAQAIQHYYRALELEAESDAEHEADR